MNTVLALAGFIFSLRLTLWFFNDVSDNAYGTGALFLFFFSIVNILAALRDDYKVITGQDRSGWEK